jgi:hypothetical protein
MHIRAYATHIIAYAMHIFACATHSWLMQRTYHFSQPETWNFKPDTRL